MEIANRGTSFYFGHKRVLVSTLLALALIVGVSIAVVSAGGHSSGGLIFSGQKNISTSDQTSSRSASLPAQLPESVGFVPNASDATFWTEVATSSAPLWSGVISSDNPAPYSATQLGLTGGLSQVWVSSAAVAEYGKLGAGLQLPVPLSFAEGNPGPIELTVQELAFSNDRSPATLLSNPSYSHIDWSGVTVASATGVDGGRVLSINSAANDGLSEYQFQWVNGKNWVVTSILGSSMSEQQAATLAAQVIG